MSYQDGKLISIKNKLKGGSYEEKYSYDSKGKLISVVSEKQSRTYTYNEDEKLTKITTEIFKLGSSTNEYFYSNGKLDSTFFTLTFDGLGSMLSSTTNNEDYRINKKYSQESEGNMILKEIDSCEKNKKGDIIEEVVSEFDPEGNITKTTITKYEYNYDEKGNWIQKRSIEDGVLKETEYRTIVYKGGDTKIYLDEMESIIKSFGGSNNFNNSNQNDEETESNVPIPSTNNYEQSSGSRSQEVKSKCSTCNGSGKCRECGKTFRKQYYKGNGSYESRNESRPGLVMCNDCFGRGHRQVKRTGGGWEPGEDCYVRGCEDGWRYCRECNNYGNGKNIGQCQSCKGTGFRN
jgi:YD repeat-containing protein